MSWSDKNNLNTKFKVLFILWAKIKLAHFEKGTINTNKLPKWGISLRSGGVSTVQWAHPVCRHKWWPVAMPQKKAVQVAGIQVAPKDDGIVSSREGGCHWTRAFHRSSTRSFTNASPGRRRVNRNVIIYYLHFLYRVYLRIFNLSNYCAPIILHQR